MIPFTIYFTTFAALQCQVVKRLFCSNKLIDWLLAYILASLITARWDDRFCLTVVCRSSGVAVIRTSRRVNAASASGRCTRRRLASTSSWTRVSSAANPTGRAPPPSDEARCSPSVPSGAYTCPNSSKEQVFLHWLSRQIKLWMIMSSWFQNRIISTASPGGGHGWTWTSHFCQWMFLCLAQEAKKYS